jgi:hypothetical protein
MQHEGAMRQDQSQETTCKTIGGRSIDWVVMETGGGGA